MRIKTLVIDENATLTTEHPASHYNTPVLLLSNGEAYGPSEKTYPEKFDSVFGDRRAAHSVFRFAEQRDLSDEELAFVRLYLSQWPEGPQV